MAYSNGAAQRAVAAQNAARASRTAQQTTDRANASARKIASDAARRPHQAGPHIPYREDGHPVDQQPSQRLVVIGLMIFGLFVVAGAVAFALVVAANVP